MDPWSKNLRGASSVDSTARLRSSKTSERGKSPVHSTLPPKPSAPRSVIKPQKLVFNNDSSPKDVLDETSSLEASFSSLDAQDYDYDYKSGNESVQVFIRMRPANRQEVQDDKHEDCLELIGSKGVTLDLKEKYKEPYKFHFDSVLPPNTTQSEVFEAAGGILIDNCLAGINTSIFAYGQTGAGKTYTVMGDLQDPDKRGLAPRIFEQLFNRIGDNEDSKNTKYSVKCSYLEIYNEVIADLLNPATLGGKLEIREDPEKGPYVEGLTEPVVLNADEMLALLQKGSDNRHVGETKLNRESSRSHSVFVCTVEKCVTHDGVSKIFFARINLIDLAGSERISSGALGGSAAAGDHFKEACHINKSLTALGRVTTALLESQKPEGSRVHVPYRDSKLTFLLQNSLGGNARTLIIANVSSSYVCGQETLSTLRFAKSAKFIRNEAKVNWTVQGDRVAMQKEIERLRSEIMALRSGTTEPLIHQNEKLTKELDVERQLRESLEIAKTQVENDAKQLRRDLTRLERKLTDTRTTSERLDVIIHQLSVRLAEVENWEAAYKHHMENVMATELALKDKELNGFKTAHTREMTATLVEKDNLVNTLATLKKEQAEMHKVYEAIVAQLKEEQMALADVTEQKENLDGVASELELRCENLESTLQKTSVEKVGMEAQLQEEARTLKESIRSLESSLQGTKEILSSTAQQLAEENATLSKQICNLEDELASLSKEKESLDNKLTEEQEASETLKRDHSSEVHGMQEAAAKLQHELFATSEALQEKEQALFGTQQALAYTTEQLETTEEQLRASEQIREHFEGELASTRSSLKDTEAQLAAVQENLGETQTALQASQDDCGRLTRDLTESNDLVSSLEGQKAQLEQKLLDTLAQLERTTMEEAHLREELSRAHERGSNLSGDLMSSQDLVSELEGEKSRLEAELETLQAEHAAVCGSLASAETENDALKQNLAQLDAKKESLEGTVAELEASLAETSEKLQAQIAETETLTAERDQLSAVTQEKQAVIEDLTKRLDNSNLEGSELQSAMASLQDKCASLEAQICDKDIEIEHLNGDKDGLTTVVSGLMEQVEQLKEQVSTGNDTESGLRSDVSVLQMQLESVKSQSSARLATIEELQEKLQEEEKAHSNSRMAVMDGQKDLGRIKLEMSRAEQEHLAQAAELKKKLQQETERVLRREKELVDTKYTLQGEISKLNATLESSKKEALSFKEKLDKSLQDTEAQRAQLAAQANELHMEQNGRQQLQKELAQQKASFEEQRHMDAEGIAMKDKYIKKLEQEIETVRKDTSDMNRRLTAHNMHKNRQAKAMEEIRRLINWAVSPPGSTRSSVILSNHAASIAPVPLGLPLESMEQAGLLASLQKRSTVATDINALSPPASPKPIKCNLNLSSPVCQSPAVASTQMNRLSLQALVAAAQALHPGEDISQGLDLISQINDAVGSDDSEDVDTQCDQDNHDHDQQSVHNALMDASRKLAGLRGAAAASLEADVDV